MKKFSDLAKILIVIIALSIIAACSFYNYEIGKVSNSDKAVEITIESGDSFLTIADTLKKNNLIKSELFYKLYIKLFKITGLEAGKYSLSENMGVKKIVETLKEGSTYNPNAVTITFKEGINMRAIAALIAEKTDNTSDDVFSTLEDESYLDELISKYWFLTDEIKNDDIYYSLEGYLFPNTYEFTKTTTVKEIFEAMLDQMEIELTNFKADIEKSEYTVHEILTLASIVELEAANSDDRAGVAGVFYNRLEAGWSLGSDVTTYYAIKVDVSERDLYQSELNDYNAYNTRSSKMAGKLPVGPICIPGKDSIEAAVNPTNHDYFYFVADKNKKTYFSKTSAEHTKTINTLKSEDLWYEY